MEEASVSGESMYEQVSINELGQWVLHWLIRAELARTVGERIECQRMMRMYCDEIERRKDNGRGGEGN